MRYAFIKTPRAVLEDEPFLAFDRTADGRAWCEAALLSWPGDGRIELGFALSAVRAAGTLRGKDVVQLRSGPQAAERRTTVAAGLLLASDERS